MKERIVVAMSGGVDSSVAAALLKEKGYEVIGITMKTWDHLPEKECDRFGSCCSPEDIADARAVADSLKIPFYVVNLEKEFRTEVVDYFISSYLKGLTPNPCIPCNNKLKFYSLMNYAHKIGATKVATGHYAIIDYKEDGTPLLKRGKDKTKDQTYFLFNLTKKQLQKTLMPLGGYTKQEIRALAASLGLSVADKKESQEICFIPDNDYGAFIKSNTSPEQITPGDIVTLDNTVLGQHKGIIYYTVGQRKGLGIGHPHPLYVINIDTQNNRIVVGEKEKLYKKEFFVTGVTWLDPVSDKKEISADVQIRYRHTASKATIKITSKERVRIIFDKKQKSVTPGQAAVFYHKNDRVIGGGWIIQEEKT